MLDSIKEFASSTFNTAVNRVKNPAFGAFSLSWCAFNWKSILYLFLSGGDVLDKINYISSNSSWKTAILYPCFSVAVICAVLPWINNIISRWQAKPIDNNDSIDNLRKAKLILRATRLQRLQAKHDVTYDKVKTGAEKDIQNMKEEIISSKDRVGALTSELKEKEEELYVARGEITTANSIIKEMKSKLEKQNNNYSVLKKEFDDFKSITGKVTIKENKVLPSFGNLNEKKLKELEGINWSKAASISQTESLLVREPKEKPGSVSLHTNTDNKITKRKDRNQ
ncbi:hypothetical protein ACRS85_04670 [Pluralibacter gergoviae]|uniref:hypothetical protein n=1 Tax=Pluralibacter gergoviae TaxID=61647 RepID=UPI000AC75135|nr:hypothetical protein [Pluralibacter gergoviae]